MIARLTELPSWEIVLKAPSARACMLLGMMFVMTRLNTGKSTWAIVSSVEKNFGRNYGACRIGGHDQTRDTAIGSDWAVLLFMVMLFGP